MNFSHGFPNPLAWVVVKCLVEVWVKKNRPPRDFITNFKSKVFRPKYHEGTFAFPNFLSILFSVFRIFGTTCSTRSKLFPIVLYFRSKNHSRPIWSPVFGPRSSSFKGRVDSIIYFRVQGTTWSRIRATESSFSQKRNNKVIILRKKLFFSRIFAVSVQFG